MTDFITLHDGTVSKRRYPVGKPVLVRADSIDTLRGYPSGRVRCVVGIHGSYLHTTEYAEQILAMVEWVKTHA